MKVIIACIIAMGFLACMEPEIPKPTGYFRIDLPEKEYRVKDSIPFPFSFEIPAYAYVNLKRTQRDSNFLNIDYPRFRARIHLSYLPVDSNLARLLEDARTLVYKHVSKAQDIKENLIYNEQDRVFGMYYQIAGDAASGAQFFLTDSTEHFLRGALYFNSEPNFDSIAPVQNFIMQDMEHFLESFRWKDE